MGVTTSTSTQDDALETRPQASLIKEIPYLRSLGDSRLCQVDNKCYQHGIIVPNTMETVLKMLKMLFSLCSSTGNIGESALSSLGNWKSGT